MKEKHKAHCSHYRLIDQKAEDEKLGWCPNCMTNGIEITDQYEFAGTYFMPFESITVNRKERYAVYQKRYHP